MVRVKRRRSRARSRAWALGSTLPMVLVFVLVACSGTEESSEEPIIVHARTFEPTDSRWKACIHEPSPVPEDIQRAVEELPSLPDCPHDVPLPCGTCSDEGELCAAAVTRGCCGKPYVINSAFPPIDGWVCRCEGGEYNCWIRSPGASACNDCDMPAGTCSESATGECAEGCFPVVASPFDPERDHCVAPFETVDCTSIYETTFDPGCVRRVSDGAIFLATSFTRHLQSDAWAACSREEIESILAVCDSP